MSDYGYIRVSKSSDESRNLDTQRRILAEAGIARLLTFEDVASGATFDKRPGWQALQAEIQAGDRLVVAYLDRMSRDTIEGLIAVKNLLESGVGFWAIRDGLEIAGVGRMSAMDKLRLEMMLAVSSYHVESTRERIREGVQRARDNGKRLGRGPVVTPDKSALARQLHAQGQSVRRVAATLNVSTGTAHKLITATEE